MKFFGNRILMTMVEEMLWSMIGSFIMPNMLILITKKIYIKAIVTN